MVAEQSGKIRFYDITSMRPIMSLNVGLKPIFSADWSPVNPLKVGAVAGNDWYIWDVSKSRYLSIVCYYIMCSFNHMPYMGLVQSYAIYGLSSIICHIWALGSRKHLSLQGLAIGWGVSSWLRDRTRAFYSFLLNFN